MYCCVCSKKKKIVGVCEDVHTYTGYYYTLQVLSTMCTTCDVYNIFLLYLLYSCIIVHVFSYWIPYIGISVISVDIFLKVICNGNMFNIIFISISSFKYICNTLNVIIVVCNWYTMFCSE